MRLRSEGKDENKDEARKWRRIKEAEKKGGD